MTNKIQYTDATDRETILEANKNLFLIEEQNITEGNFLIFSDIPVPIAPVIPIYVDISKSELDMLQSQLQTTQDAVDFLTMGGM